MRARSTLLKNYVPGPGFPDRRHDRRYARGRSPKPTPPAAARSACARAGRKEDTGRGTYQIVITEIPWLVQKSRLIEKIAELFNDKKLPLIADVRDEFDRRCPRRHRAARPHGRCRAADGIAVQADRAREPHSAQHERAGQGQGAQGARPCRGAARMARPPPRGAGAAFQAPAGARSSTGWKCSAASSSPISTSTRSSRSSATRTSPSPS